MALSDGKHVMLSYNWGSQNIVSKVCDILKSENIPVWFDIAGDMKADIYNSMSDGVENAAIVCCFMSPEYQKSDNCELELKYAKTRRTRIIPCIVTDQKEWKPSGWLGVITAGLLYIKFKDDSEEYIRLKAKEIIDQIKEQPSAPKAPTTEPTYLMEVIKDKYTQNARIELLMNPGKSFPIEQSYINLAIVKAKEQNEKEKQLHDAQHNTTIIGTFEEIYGSKTAIEIEDMFEACKNQEKQVLVFGRAGIGKSTFCRYVAYQWAKGKYWSQYEFLVLIPLRRLTTNRYPPNKSYSLIDLVKKEVFKYDLSEKHEKLLKQQFDTKKVLWILDGYDEIVQNVPPHLEDLFEQLLKTPYHILTSRPYLNKLSYDVQMEITGFTDDNIEKYVQQFFEQMKDELDDVSVKNQNLLNFLKSNSSVWGVAHIPVNLELICSLWSNEDLSETQQLTITTLYTMMTEWLCKRYLRTQGDKILQLSKEEIDECCQTELAFLESLAFNAMESNTIILRPNLLKKARNEAKVTSKENPNILNIGMLKSFHKQGVGTCVEMNKDHYFVHLSFQEYFAARYLITALKKSSTEKGIQFIKYQKYNQRYALVFAFAAGLLSEDDTEPSFNIFWDNILEQPIDIVGIRHMQLVICCLEETSVQSTFSQRPQLLDCIAKCIEYSFSKNQTAIYDHLLQSLQRAQSVGCDQTIINMLIKSLQSNDTNTKGEMLTFVSHMKIKNPPKALITSLTTTLDDENSNVRARACEALGAIGEKAATQEVISKLVSTLEDKSNDVRREACCAIGEMGEKAATNEVISKLVNALDDEDSYVIRAARSTLGAIVEKGATNELISKLVSALEDHSQYVRHYACEALGEIGDKAATNEVITKLVGALDDENERVRREACEALGNMGEKAATNEVISKLVRVLEDEGWDVRHYACEALGKIGEKATTNEVINQLVSALGDKSKDVRRYACGALGRIGNKAATTEVISKLTSALEDGNKDVRRKACYALSNIGEKAATDEVISKLATALGDESKSVRHRACEALGEIGEKAATNEVISKLVSALGDKSEYVREKACEALGEIGGKVATNELISKLVSALENESIDVRRYACDALGKLGEKTATNEVISKLVSALEDESEDVRQYVCEVLGRIGNKAPTNEVMTKLMCALDDESERVRWKACEALGNIGEKAATNEVISKLVSALEDESEDVRQCVCVALGTIGEKLPTDEVMSKLASALKDESKDVRQKACKALGHIGKKVVTNEVISQLVSTLEDKSKAVRREACKALRKIGEKAATTEVMSKLVSALEDQNKWIIQQACYALGRIGEKAATHEVMSKLVNAVEDESKDVRQEAYKALVKIGKKAATSEVISKLVSALGDKSEDVRQYACEALGEMCEKAATTEVISKLTSTLEDGNKDVRRKACYALGKIGEKAATDEVISKLVVLANSGNSDSYEASNAIESILSSSFVIAQLDSKIISDLCMWKKVSVYLENVPEDQLIDIFLTTKNSDWLCLVSEVVVVKGAAITVTEDKVVIYGSKEPVKLAVGDSKLRQQLIETFSDQSKRLHLSLEMISDASRYEP